MYHDGSIGDVLKKYGTIDFWTHVSMIRRLSMTANLEQININDIERLPKIRSGDK